jgi:hypothetical protein
MHCKTEASVYQISHLHKQYLRSFAKSSVRKKIASIKKLKHTLFCLYTWCGFEAPGMILLCNRELWNCIVVKTCLCMFQLASVTLSVH